MTAARAGEMAKSERGRRTQKPETTIPARDETNVLRSPLVLTGAGILLVFTLVAVFAPALSPYDPRALSGEALEPPSARHLLGTNNIGQDILSQIIWGTRPSLTVAIGAACVALAIGVSIGMVAALLGGVTDVVAMRVVDVFLALPVAPLLIVVAALASPSRAVLILAIGLVFWPVSARIIRSQTLSLRARGFVQAARGFGGGTLYVMRRHLLPALGPIVVTRFVNLAATAALLEAGLAFLGLGDPTAVSWGLMLNRALLHQGLYFSPLWTWWVLPAGFAVTLAVLGFTLLGVGLEPRFNPRWRRAA